MENNEVLSPKDSGKFIAANSKDVSISSDGVQKVAKLICSALKENPEALHTNRWKMHDLNPKTADLDALHWVFLTDIGNFSFWSDNEEEKYMVRFSDKEWTGYWSWCAAVNRALKEGKKITEPEYMAELNKNTLVEILRSDTDTPIPMIDERLKVINEAGKVLVEKYQGSFVNVIKKANKSAQDLLNLLVEEFSSLQDVAEFCGKKVSIYKRAQILIADLWACFEGQGYGEFDDIDTITMFADYRIPQALCWFNVLEYSKELKESMEAGTFLVSGERKEVEIRGCTIEAVERIVEEVKKMVLSNADITNDTKINAIVVDHFLWDYRREHAKETAIIPIHKIRCIYY